MPDEVYCIHCGASIPTSAQFCSTCGKPQGSAALAVPDAAPLATPPVGWAPSGVAMSSPPTVPLGGSSTTNQGTSVFLALAGGVGLLVACLLPIDPGFSLVPIQPDQTIQNGLWFSVEPVASAVLVVVVALALLSHSIRGNVAAGFFVGIGVAEALYFLGYVGSAAASPADSKIDASLAGMIGIVAGIIVAAAGVAAASSAGAKGNE